MTQIHRKAAFVEGFQVLLGHETFWSMWPLLLGH